MRKYINELKEIVQQAKRLEELIPDIEVVLTKMCEHMNIVGIWFAKPYGGQPL